MSKTTKDPAKKRQWMFLNTARNFKESHEVGMVFKSKTGTKYIVGEDGAWRKLK